MNVIHRLWFGLNLYFLYMTLGTYTRRLTSSQLLDSFFSCICLLYLVLKHHLSLKRCHFVYIRGNNILRHVISKSGLLIQMVLVLLIRWLVFRWLVKWLVHLDWWIDAKVGYCLVIVWWWPSSHNWVVLKHHGLLINLCAEIVLIKFYQIVIWGS